MWKLFFIFLAAAAAFSGPAFPYDLRKPAASYVLPDSLHEVSGVTALDSARLACVQDENGIVFVYDLLRGGVTTRIPFAGDGDYEGIARKGDTMFVLRSDGVIFEIDGFASVHRKVRTHFTGIPIRNSEGLCYDAAHNRLLIGCKSKPEDDTDARLIYAFNLNDRKLVREPVLRISTAAVIAWAQERNIALPMKSRKKYMVPWLRISTSEIALHPLTRELYLLSAHDKVMLVFGMDGKLIRLERLEPALFNKAEGITFLHNADMLVTNEGQKGVPTLRRFRYAVAEKK